MAADESTSATDAEESSEDFVLFLVVLLVSISLVLVSLVIRWLLLRRSRRKLLEAFDIEECKPSRPGRLRECGWAVDDKCPTTPQCRPPASGCGPRYAAQQSSDAPPPPMLPSKATLSSADGLDRPASSPSLPCAPSPPPASPPPQPPTIKASAGMPTMPGPSSAT
eukprot:gnl/TRDRNA2_/TRDRNA2_149587_c0_seq1.p2 gnl/TRDRNA2_/TRDRNA2_149587_c0~~gnl/TRDRNA2_/TRDRNA2_149587_c0_seq1.p2  ORF type:complete len:180 (+),score=27.78 gnl/TRDRNA2_/TRDRNA2_149587_c0_seq1:44-541(+)